jgi:hypothetical protein
MAKPVTKTVTDKKTPPKKAAKPKTSSIDKIAEDILSKLKALNIEHQLQADIEWCLGSYRYDHNPAGLFETASKALAIFKQEQAKKTKGVTATLISGIEKVLS